MKSFFTKKKRRNDASEDGYRTAHSGSSGDQTAAAAAAATAAASSSDGANKMMDRLRSMKVSRPMALSRKIAFNGRKYAMKSLIAEGGFSYVYMVRQVSGQGFVNAISNVNIIVTITSL